jgi:polar amino acid transport system permease protein
MRFVVLPQALVAMIPPFGNLLIELLKSTALVSLIAVPDLTLRGRFLADHKGNRADVIATWLAVMALYFVLSRAIAAGARALERRLGRGLERGGLR